MKLSMINKKSIVIFRHFATITDCFETAYFIFLVFLRLTLIDCCYVAKLPAGGNNCDVVVVVVVVVNHPTPFDR